MATGYEDIDSLMNQQNNLLNEQQKKQNELINQQTQIQTDELNREKEKIDKDVDKTNQSLFMEEWNMSSVGIILAVVVGIAILGLVVWTYRWETSGDDYNENNDNVSKADSAK